MHAHTYEKDLGRWIPILIRLWRESSRASAQNLPADRLSREEIRRLVTSVRKLTNAFSHSRNIVGSRYLDEPDLLGAYLLYFWPVSYVQARYCLDNVATMGVELKLDNCLDLGSGPGPLSCALLDCKAGKVTAADHSQAALSLAGRIARCKGQTIATQRVDAQSGGLPGKESYDCIVMGHALNELWPQHPRAVALRTDFIQNLATRLTPQGSILLIEPALKDVNRQLLEVRDILRQRGLRTVAPCFFPGPCPALQDPNGTCYAAYRWRMPGLMAELAAAAGPDKDELKMSFLCVQPATASVPQTALETAELYRVDSDHMLNKAGRSRMIWCGLKGRIVVSVKRGEGLAAEKDFFALHRGDAIRATGLEARGDNWALGPQTRIEALDPR
jgi:2-polyprenyl-3-methyl-5-hydroxy-6-metoxy-1,4-benzoquinol methylase